MIQIHEKKYNRQLLGVERWRNAKSLGSSHTNCWGTWHWQTGVGKTFGACIIINKMLANNSANTIIIIVPGPELEKQWVNEIHSNIEEKYWINIRVLTIEAGILSQINQGNKFICSLLIVDELHKYYTDERMKIFDKGNIITKWCLALTADYYDKNNYYKNIEPILPVVDRIDQDEAIKEGYISKYIEYNLAVELTESEQEKYKFNSELITKNLSKFGHGGLDLCNEILKGGISVASAYASTHGWRKGMSMMNPDEAKILDLWSPNKVIGYAKNAMDNIRERKDLLYFCRNKLVIARDIVIKFDDLKTICFSQSTFFADMLGKVINDYYKGINQQCPCVVYHSQLETVVSYDDTGKQKKKGQTILKREAIEAIRSGKARIISTASSLDQGFDVRDIRLALTTSGTQNPTQYNQRKGRAVRIESYEEDILVLIINLYARGTMDEIWLKKRQSKSNNIVYWVDSINDINYSPRVNKELTNNEIKV